MQGEIENRITGKSVLQYLSSCQGILYFMQTLKSNFNTIINGNQARQFLEEIEAMLLSYYAVIFSVSTNFIFVGKLFED